MKIKEVEQRLELSRANIRYYEKEGLLTPDRGENRYRDYSEEDVARLRQIILLRKLGLPIAEIRAIFLVPDTFQPALQRNITALEQQMEQLQGALSLCRTMEREQAGVEDLDRYWPQLTRRERAGDRFADLGRDYLAFEEKVAGTVLDYLMIPRLSPKDSGLAAAAGVLLAVCVVRGLGHQFLWKDGFWTGFWQPFVLFLILSVLLLPDFLLGRKHPEAEKRYRKVLGVLSMVLLGLVLLALVVLLVNARLHFLF